MNTIRSIAAPVAVVAALMAAATARAEPADRVPASGPLPPQWVAVFAAIEADPPPAELTNEKHYVVSNERRLELFHQAIKRRGGIYVGIGADQNYVFAAWARPEVMILFDFDQVVIDLHSVYRAFFLAAPTPAGFLALWSPEQRERGRQILIDTYADDDRRRWAALEVFAYAGEQVHQRLVYLRDRLSRRRGHSFLDRPAQYRRLVQLFEEGRVFAVRGDLLGERTVQQIGRAAKRARRPVRVLYLSNAEQYFMYSRGPFKRNLLTLPFDRRSQVIRTLPAKPSGFDFMVQAGRNFRGWLRHRRTYSLYNMYHLRRYEEGSDRLSVIDAAPGTRPQAADEVAPGPDASR